MMPEPTQRDIEWAYRLWNGLALGGTWTLPEVGVYVRTGDTQLTLGIMHSSKPVDDAFGSSIFDRHDWIVGLSELIGWNVKEDIHEAFDSYDDQIVVKDGDIGNVALCDTGCGAIIRIVALEAGVQYIPISMEGQCPLCGELEAIPHEMRGKHVVVDDSAYLMKQKKAREAPPIAEEE